VITTTIRLLFNLKYGTSVRGKTYQARYLSHSSQRIPMEHRAPGPSVPLTLTWEVVLLMGEGVRPRSRIGQTGLEELMMRLTQLTDSLELRALTHDVKPRALTI